MSTRHTFIFVSLLLLLAGCGDGTSVRFKGLNVVGAEEEYSFCTKASAGPANFPPNGPSLGTQLRDSLPVSSNTSTDYSASVSYKEEKNGPQILRKPRTKACGSYWRDERFVGAAD